MTAAGAGDGSPGRPGRRVSGTREWPAWNRWFIRLRIAVTVAAPPGLQGGGAQSIRLWPPASEMSGAAICIFSSSVAYARLPALHHLALLPHPRAAHPGRGAVGGARAGPALRRPSCWDRLWLVYYLP